MSKTTAKIVIATYLTLFLALDIYSIKAGYVDEPIHLFIALAKPFLIWGIGAISFIILLRAIHTLLGDDIENEI